MKKGCIGLVVLGVIALALFGWVKNGYNGLVTDQESVETAWANVESQYQRRADLIPNLVETVKGYAKHEQETLEGVIEARANATKVTIDPTKMTPEDLQKYQAAQGDVTNALSRLIAVSESYPDLKANENFKDLQTQLEGTENRINKARNDFNEVAREYNTKRRTFPTNIIASVFNFGEKPYFQAQEGADKAPKVDFGTSEGK
ncbi:MAG: LemA family protein [Muribaculaceae bacterium]|jgi:LemA protein|nr:LemA family protein [Muribaculaceae bacterium]MBR6948414.1 LemA family protein [Muribaculaceae bacterium]